MKHRYSLNQWDKRGGWVWYHTTTGDDDHPAVQGEYRTDSDYEGLWVRMPDSTWKQVRGSCQFRVPAERRNALRVLRHFDLAPDPELPF